MITASEVSKKPGAVHFYSRDRHRDYDSDHWGWPMPPSQLTWLDYSEDDQRRARELVAMFSQRESRDELGIGVVRDALSDALFPGTSVLLTRARYFLFVPWLFLEGFRRGYSGPQLTGWIDRQERQLVEALRAGGDTQGLVGRIAGAAVQNLPSTVYWNSLRSFGILRHSGTAIQVAGLQQRSRATDGATELLERPDAVWQPSIPPAPPGFFDLKRCDFVLTRDEAGWLTERIVEAAPETLLGYLVQIGARPADDTAFAWTDADALDAPEHVRETLAEARRFALALHGAALLYNVLLTERADELDLSGYEGYRDGYVADLDQWEREVASSDLARWDTGALWALVGEHGGSVTLRTRAFVEQWLELTRGRLRDKLADHGPARELVAQRELLQKGSQARLKNDRLMRQWGGVAGYSRLNFRWPVARRLLGDIADAQGRDNAVA